MFIYLQEVVKVRALYRQMEPECRPIVLSFHVDGPNQFHSLILLPDPCGNIHLSGNGSDRPDLNYIGMQ